MDHVELHNELSSAFKKLAKGQLKPQLAKEIFNGAGKLINNCRNELAAMQMGFDVDVPLLSIKKLDSENVRARITETRKKLKV